MTAHVEHELREKLATIDAQLGALTAPPEDAGAIQFGKRAGDATNVAAEQLSRVATHEQLLALRAEVERALEKIAAGTYGRCDDCGEPIAPARLEALPWAARCVRCRAAHA
jgi:RNA polymerase-binding transcription factor DksA